MPATIQERKLDRLFTILDTDNNGYIEQSDFELFAAKVIDGAGAKETPEARIVRRQAASFWSTLSEALDADGDERVSRDEFASTADLEPVLDAAIKLGVSARDVTDIDHDGRISLSEWVTLDAMLGIPRTDSEEGFHALDTDGDGFVSQPEYVRGVEQFFRSEDASAPGNWAFGKF
ncbi:EF-hand domain-containing protein [Actinokineospora sp. G85]|uniref:EF-hand domain-containing protein n=1 Tax=Actinokineospora sp. G85 TaxID=3406626 RepID=UPI003C73D0FE